MPGSTHVSSWRSGAAAPPSSSLPLPRAVRWSSLRVPQLSHRISNMHCSIVRTFYFQLSNYLHFQTHWHRASAVGLQSTLSWGWRCRILWLWYRWIRTICRNLEILYSSLWCSCSNAQHPLSPNGWVHLPAGTHTCRCSASSSFSDWTPRFLWVIPYLPLMSL